MGAVRYERFEIAFVDGPLWPFSDFEVGVRIFPAPRGTIEETLFVRPIEGSDRRESLLVTGGRKGLAGP
jgi:hypothetical protein